MEKTNILFLDFDGVLNSIRSFYKKFAEHHGVKWMEEDFDPKYWNKDYPENINPELNKKVDEAWKSLRELPYYKAPNFYEENFPVDEIAINNLNTIIGENKAKIVVCSSWRIDRSINDLQNILIQWGAKGDIIDKTPNPRKMWEARGRQIFYWLTENGKDLYKGICILDNDSKRNINYLFEPWCVQNISGDTNGLRKEHISEAKKCFETPFNIEKIKL